MPEPRVSIRWLGEQLLSDKWVLAVFGVGLLVFVLSLAVVVTKQDNRSTFIRLQKLKAQHSELRTQWTQLILEQATWANSAHIVQYASSQLNMTLPTQKDMRVLAVPANLEPDVDETISP